MRTLTLLALAALLPGAAAAAESEPVNLIQDTLDNWKLYLQEEDADPADTWTLENGVIHCTGTPLGYMRTREIYGDFHLSFEWRWPEEGGNSGVLIYMQQPDAVWPRSFEGQLYHENAGDIWLIDGADFAERDDPEHRRTPKKADDSELPLGEWNTFEVIARGNTFTLIVNGVVQNEATETNMYEGYIGFQSEGTPVEFRNIMLARF